MNISKIRDMVQEGDISSTALLYLLECKAECEHLDYKQQLTFDNDYTCVSISKDIVAMKNIGGGYIVIGVEDKTWKPIGITEEVFSEPRDLIGMVRKYTGLDLAINGIHHSIEITGQIKLFGLILIRSSVKRSKLKKPSICKLSYKENEKWGIRSGDVYVRDNDSTSRLIDMNLIENVIESLEYKYNESNQIQTQNQPSPFAVNVGFYRLLPKEYEGFVGRESYKKELENGIEKDERIWIINLHGPGGVGKSALATWIAYKYYIEKKFDAILHLSAKDTELSTERGIQSLRPSLISLEDFLNNILCLFEFHEYCDNDLQGKKDIAITLLSDYSTLIILDNMETVNDARIMDFVRSFPPEVKGKVLLTSRRRSRSWEVPIQVSEFSHEEVVQFIDVKSKEMGIKNNLITCEEVRKITEISGGLPLAIQWILGEVKLTGNCKEILSRVITPDSPLLEFSFRNSWNALDTDAQKALSVLSIFDEPPTKLIWRTVLNWSIDNMESAISKLEEVTFVTEHIDKLTYQTLYYALPITLSFAKNELAKFGDLGSKARMAYSDFKNRLELASDGLEQSKGLFQKFTAVTAIQQKAILLCRMAEGQASSLGIDEAEEYFKQALQIDPQSVYALVTYAKFKSEFFDNEEAIQLISNALKYVNKSNGFFVHYNIATIYDKQKDLNNMVFHLKQALTYEPENTMAEHALGVALGKMNDHDSAIEIFNRIIERELTSPYPGKSLIYAVNTKIISLNRMDRTSEINTFLENVSERIDAKRTNGYIKEELLKIQEKYS